MNARCEVRLIEEVISPSDVAAGVVCAVCVKGFEVGEAVYLGAPSLQAEDYDAIHAGCVAEWREGR